MAVALVRAQGLVLPPPKLEMEMNHGPRERWERKGGDRSRIQAMPRFKGCLEEKPRERDRGAGKRSVQSGGGLQSSLGILLAPIHLILRKWKKVPWWESQGRFPNSTHHGPKLSPLSVILISANSITMDLNAPARSLRVSLKVSSFPHFTDSYLLPESH